MRRLVLGVLLCLFLPIFSVRGAQLPLTAKDVGLMLRMGYSASVIEKELSVRHFADTVDSFKEAQLVQAGGTPELLFALKNGAYSVPPEEIARAQEEIAAQAKRRAAEAEKSKKFNTLYQDQLAKQRAVAQVQASTTGAIYSFVKGDLVRPKNGSLVHVDDEAVAKKKLIAFYFSAYWCGPCRKFTPQLVEYYNRITPLHPEFEIIFFSLDKSAAKMEAYMREMNMPWPALDYQKLAEKEVLKKNAGSGIPSLVLVDQSGKVLSSAYVGTEYRGPAKVLADLDAIFAGGAPPQVAVRQ
jgi:nucleoredoxin